MNKNILSLCLAVSPLALSAWNVGTAPEPSRALIEEYTGIHCPNCPDGHAVAAQLMGLHPGDVYSVAIHAGSYADAKGTEPDFTTELGEMLNTYFEIPYYPCGVVNRSSGPASRTSWGDFCRGVLARTSPVNLWTSSEYDPASRTLTLEVEGYFTSAMSDPRLNVFLLQSEILGPQSGGQLGVEYPHRHMLRDRLSSADFGDTLDAKGEGEYFTKTYTYIMPADFKGVATDPVNMSLMVFVTEGEGEVAQVTEEHLHHPDFIPSLSVEAKAAPIAIGSNYAFDYVDMMVYNHGGVEVENVSFDLTLNGDKQTVVWSGSIPGHSAQVVKIPLDGSWAGAVYEENNSYIIRMMKVNGQEVESPSVRGSFNEIGSFPADLTLRIKTDSHAADNAWRILDTDGETVAEFGPYAEGVVEEYENHVQLVPGEVYCLEVTDAWGDGVVAPAGYVKLYDKEGKQVGQYREIRGYGLRQFFRAVDTDGVTLTGADPCGGTDAYFDLSGRRVGAEASGVLIRRSTDASGNAVYTKIIK